MKCFSGKYNWAGDLITFAPIGLNEQKFTKATIKSISSAFFGLLLSWDYLHETFDFTGVFIIKTVDFKPLYPSGKKRGYQIAIDLNKPLSSITFRPLLKNLFGTAISIRTERIEKLPTACLWIKMVLIFFPSVLQARLSLHADTAS